MEQWEGEKSKTQKQRVEEGSTLLLLLWRRHAEGGRARRRGGGVGGGRGGGPGEGAVELGREYILLTLPSTLTNENIAILKFLIWPPMKKVWTPLF